MNKNPRHRASTPAVRLAFDLSEEMYNDLRDHVPKGFTRKIFLHVIDKVILTIKNEGDVGLTTLYNGHFDINTTKCYVEERTKLVGLMQKVAEEIPDGKAKDDLHSLFGILLKMEGVDEA